MTSPDWKTYLDDIAQAVERINRYVDGMSFDEFAQDERTQDAVLRNIAVIGEAARQVSQTTRGAHPAIEWAKITGMRNRLAHDYRSIDMDVVWIVVVREIPTLQHIADLQP